MTSPLTYKNTHHKHIELLAGAEPVTYSGGEPFFRFVSDETSLEIIFWYVRKIFQFFTFDSNHPPARGRDFLSSCVTLGNDVCQMGIWIRFPKRARLRMALFIFFRVSLPDWRTRTKILIYIYILIVRIVWVSRLVLCVLVSPYSNMRFHLIKSM